MHKHSSPNYFQCLLNRPIFSPQHYRLSRVPKAEPLQIARDFLTDKMPFLSPKQEHSN